MASMNDHGSDELALIKIVVTLSMAEYIARLKGSIFVASDSLVASLLIHFSIYSSFEGNHFETHNDVPSKIYLVTMPSSNKLRVYRATGIPTSDAADTDQIIRLLLNGHLSDEEKKTIKYKITIVPSCDEDDDR
ncbi:MAG: hypothetical protein M1834_009044 [Cirrosporium novae-zelandiae]|nr:MAG: hypothetical protein M1834_009044 [Cirrosporium novae-zelandiae]